MLILVEQKVKWILDNIPGAREKQRQEIFYLEQ